MKPEAGSSLRRSSRKVVLDSYKLAEEKTANLKRLGHVEHSDAEEPFTDGTARELMHDPNYELSDDEAEFGENEAESVEAQSDIKLFAGDKIDVFDQQKRCYKLGVVQRKRFKDISSERKPVFFIKFGDTNVWKDLSDCQFKKREKLVVKKKV